jgi:hypothetical protein
MLIRNRIFFAPADEGAAGAGAGADAGADAAKAAAAAGGAGAGAGADAGKAGADGAGASGNGASGDAGKPDTAWRALFKDPEVLKEVERSTDPDAFGKRIVELRKQLSTAVVKPGKLADNATEAQKSEHAAKMSAYRKAMDIPDEAKGYEFAKPEFMSDDEFKSEKTQATLANIAKVAHEAGAPKAVVASLWDFYVRAEQQAMETAKAEDKKFVEQTEAQLRKDWGADFDKNKVLATRAAHYMAEKAGVDMAELKTMETKDGKLLLDHPIVMKMYAHIGREMGEGTLGPAHSETDIAGMEKQIEAKRDEINKLQAEGKGDQADREYQNLLAMRAKLGNKPIVGSQNRAA